MRVVERAITAPSRCAVLPYIGPDDGPFIDTGSEMPGKGDQWDLHIYVSFKGLHALVQTAGWPTPEQHQALQSQVDDLTERLAASEEAREKAEGFVGAIDAIESADFRARKKPGRPKTKTGAAA